MIDGTGYGRSVCGHTRQLEWLRHAFASRRAPHAMLLTGPQQLGKTTVARIVSESLLCARPTDGLSCGTCDSCRMFRFGNHPDFDSYRPVLIRDRARGSDSSEASGVGRRPYDDAPEMMDSASLPIGLVRQMRERASRRSALDGRRVVFINEADRLTEDAQDAILKTIEEPGEGLTILLIAENAARIRPTVRSRCSSITFSFVERKEMETWLALQGSTDPETSRRAVENACGRPGAALRRVRHPELLDIDDQIRSFVVRLRGEPVRSLRMSEEFEALARERFDAEQASDPNPVNLTGSGHASRIQRSASIRLIDALADVVRTRNGSVDADILDTLFEAKHNLIQNANIRLALDVLFLKLAR